jgi:hypothetical protein
MSRRNNAFLNPSVTEIRAQITRENSLTLRAVRQPVVNFVLDQKKNLIRKNHSRTDFFVRAPAAPNELHFASPIKFALFDASCQNRLTW